MQVRLTNCWPHCTPGIYFEKHTFLLLLKVITNRLNLYYLKYVLGLKNYVMFKFRQQHFKYTYVTQSNTGMHVKLIIEFVSLF